MDRLTWVVVAISLLSSIRAFGLDYEKEIRRQERAVKVQYSNPPRTMGSFLKRYPECQGVRGNERMRCNLSIAKEKYAQYFHAWKAQQSRRVSSVETGDLTVQLEKRARE